MAIEVGALEGELQDFSNPNRQGSCVIKGIIPHRRLVANRKRCEGSEQYKPVGHAALYEFVDS